MPSSSLSQQQQSKVKIRENHTPTNFIIDKENLPVG